MQEQEVTTAPLCGGKSRRMGFDKALLQVDGGYALERTCRTAREVFSRLILVADIRDKFPQRAQQGYEIVEDEFPQTGPLGGLVMALHHATTPHVFLVACDIPHISAKQIRWLAERVHDQQVVAFSGSHLETLFAFYHRSCLSVFERRLPAGELRIRTGFCEPDVECVDMGEAALDNVNMPAQLHEWHE